MSDIIYSRTNHELARDEVRLLTASYSALLKGAKNIVFLGETGSGKTETAINLALRLAREAEGGVHFFDLDQTKPLFRARDCADTLERGGVVFHFQSQYLDAPTVAPCIAERLLDGGSIVLLDVGGGAHGSHMIGQFSQILSHPETRVIYLVNPFRPWSRSLDDIRETVRRVAGAARLTRLHLAANPNFGAETSADEVLGGLLRFEELFPGERPDFVCALEEISEEVEKRSGLPVLPMRLNTLPEWMAGSGGIKNN